jgi:outer membrane autotransporter protein
MLVNALSIQYKEFLFIRFDQRRTLRMKLDIKKLLLAGTAIVAVGATAGTAQAADLTLTGNSTWGTTAPVNAPTAADNVELDGFNLAIDESDVTAIGAITDTNATPDGNVTFDSNAGDNVSTAITVGSATLGSGNFVVQATENTASGNADATAVTVTGSITTTGNVTVTGGTNAANTSDADDDATLNVAGNITATGIVLANGDDGLGTLVLNGTTAQTVTGVVSGNGSITVSNTHASGVTFSGDSTSTGTVTMNGTGVDQAVTFNGDWGAGTIVLGDNTGTDTKTATFNGTTQTIAATIAGGGAADTVALVFTGGDTITLTGVATANIDTVSVTGSTTLDSDAAITAAVTVASGSTIDQGAGDITGAITNAGTVNITGAGNLVGDIANTGTLKISAGGTGDITGDISGAGALDIDANITVTGDAGATSANVATGTTLLVAGGAGNDIAIGTTTLAGTGALTFAAGSNLTGNVVADADGDGAINITNVGATSAITGNIGTSAKKIATLDVAGAGNADTVTTTGNLYVNAITVDDADTLSFIGTSAQTVSGTITNGILNVGDGTKTTDVTFGGVIASAVTQNVQAAATARYNANATFTGAYTNAGTTKVGTGATLTAASLTDSGGTFVLDVTNADTTTVLAATDFGQISVGAAALDTDDVSINVTGLVGTAENLDIAGAATFDEAKALTDNSALYVFTVDAAHQVDVTKVATSTITNNAGQANTADRLISVGTVTGELQQVQTAFVSAGSADSANVAEAAASDVSGGAVVAGIQVAGSTSAINNDRLASLRSGETGMNAGQVMNGLNGWIEGFGQQAQQDKRDGVSGYDADTYGFAIGFDTEELGQDTTIGMSFAYADTDVDSDAISNAKTEVDSYQISLYGDYDVNETVFVSGQLGYIWSDNDTTRNPGGISTLNAKGSYNADAFVAGLAVGRDYHTGHGTLVLTPKVSADYMHYSADSYTETGAGGANLTVDADSLSLFEIGLGVDAQWDIQNANGTHLMPSIGLGVRHDLIGDEFEASNTFAGGGSAFKVKGFDPAQTTFDAGVGVKYITDTNWTLSAGYNFEFKSDYDAHAGMVKASYKF